MIPADLLSALREKDPEPFPPIQEVRYMDTLLNQLKEQDLELYQEIVADLLPSSDHRNNFIICGKLQEAIRARGWFYQIVSKGEWFLGKQISDLGVEAYVGPDPRQDLDTGYADTEAEALLRAYLEAIEAVKG